MIDTGLKHKVVLITGVHNPWGIGAATAHAFAPEGAVVFATYLRLPAEVRATTVPGEAFYRAQNTHTAEAVIAAIRARGGAMEASDVDLADPTVIPHVFDQVENVFGAVDILVNHAAHCDSDTCIPHGQLGAHRRAADAFPLRTMTAEHHDRHCAVHSRAVALTMAAYARRYVARGAQWGRIINVRTDGASGFSSAVSYGASKHALESYSRAAATELGRYGITVNMVSLGPIQTGWMTRAMDQTIAANTPLGRVGQPDDIADVMVFLASEQARWLTGQLMYVGGGWQMPLSSIAGKGRGLTRAWS